MNFRGMLGLLLSSWVLAAQAACPVTPGRFIANGAEVADSQTGLVWARCSVGQTWNGAQCIGQPTLVYHEEAMKLAQATPGWRLPNVKELASLVDRRCESPSIDTAAFPGFPTHGGQSYWSSTLDLSNTDRAWAVVFLRGGVLTGARNGDYVPAFHGSPGFNLPREVAVRLVRASP